MSAKATGAVEMSTRLDEKESPVVPSPIQPATTASIQLRGYLKKKRNRMGGWRKLYVVLQSQLLLSYASRRDYERRLAPFEDIINLVPGTRILPSAGLRFTIETTSRNFYTFRCVDHRNCSEWITALLDSLQQGGCSRGAAGTTAIPDRQFGQPSPDHRTVAPVWASLSRELGLARPFQQTVHGEPSVRGSGLRTKREDQSLPVPFQSRRLPGTVSSAVIPAPKATAIVAQREHQPDEVFADEIITKAFQFLTRPKSRDMTASEILEYYLERRQRLQLDQLRQEQANENEKGEQSALRRMADARNRTSPDVRASGRQRTLPAEDATEHTQQPTQEMREAAAPVRFRDFRLHPDADRPIVAGRSQSVDVSRINSMFGEHQQQHQQQQRREELRRGKASPIVVPNLREAGQRVSSSCSDLPPVVRQLAAGTFAASVSGPVGPGASYTLRPSMSRDASGYEYITSHTGSSSSSGSSSRSSSVSTLASSRRIELNEPIYAVVDVKAKRIRRNQQQQQQQEQQPPELPQDSHTELNHHHYEEAMPALAGAKENDLMYDQQHIYEPIMVPAPTAASATVASTTTAIPCDREDRWRRLWRNLKRIRLHPGRRSRRQVDPLQPSTVAEQPSTDSPPLVTSGTSSSSSNSSSGHQRAGLIAGLGSRLDSHRQSMKKRAKSLYDATSNAA
ncbi:uncharacterized protein LOC118463592 isoform X2 [Anopheles albimanus]|uniref:uncharacterized protein LOC118463592 isoform X2 n=1 Tax=Anopheles albimanus TaxID=7167 RepID=UPI001640E8AB|nr:uncharacterized protein LOC118463592 isoform X2 [Anopheles albimanus]